MTHHQMPPHGLNTQQVAEVLGVSTRRVIDLIADGRLGRPVRFGRSWMIDPAAIPGAMDRPNGRPRTNDSDR